MRNLELLPTKPVGCNSCISLCCRAGMIIEFTPKEAAFIRQSGTELDEQSDGSYKLLSDCGNLREDEETATTYCDVYDEEERPVICATFQPSSFACLKLRANAEIDSAFEFDTYLAATGQIALAG